MSIMLDNCRSPLSWITLFGRKDDFPAVGRNREQTHVVPHPRDEEAGLFVRTLYEQQALPLHAFAFRFTRDRALAEDVVQEVLVRAWRQASHLELGSDALRAWLFATARNHVIDTWRRHARRPVTVSDEQVSNAACATDDVDRILQRRTLADALHKLTPKHRDVLIERYFKCHSVAETAHELGVSPGTVKSRTHHAVRALRVLLSDVEMASQ
jgi:RNA polymerase sigma-70 factor (ECF subfamily)